MTDSTKVLQATIIAVGDLHEAYKNGLLSLNKAIATDLTNLEQGFRPYGLSQQTMFEVESNRLRLADAITTLVRLVGQQKAEEYITAMRLHPGSASSAAWDIAFTIEKSA